LHPCYHQRNRTKDGYMKFEFTAPVIELNIGIIGKSYRQYLDRLVTPGIPQAERDCLRNHTIPAHRSLLRVIIGQLPSDKKRESLWRSYSLDMGAWDLPDNISDEQKANEKHLTQMME
jgi:hypothetical protein